MKKIIILLAAMLLLVSCWPTNQEVIDDIKLCNDAWLGTYRSIGNDVKCSIYKSETQVMKCIREYTNWIDEKYNNPDTVSNLREDEYSNVVKACNEIFWDK